MSLKKAELEAIEALYKAEFEKARDATLEMLQKKNGKRIKEIQTELEEIDARKDKLDKELKKLEGSDLPGVGYWRGHDVQGWVQLRAKVMFASSIGDINDAISQTISEVFSAYRP